MFVVWAYPLVTSRCSSPSHLLSHIWLIQLNSIVNLNQFNPLTHVYDTYLCDKGNKKNRHPHTHTQSMGTALRGPHQWPHRCVIWATRSRRQRWQLLLHAERCGISWGGDGPFSSTKWLSSAVITGRSSRDEAPHVPSLIPEVHRWAAEFSGCLNCCQSGFASRCRWQRSWSTVSFLPFFFFSCHLVGFASGAPHPLPPPAPGPNHSLRCFMTLTAGWPCTLPQVGSRQAAWRPQITGVFILHSKSCCPVTLWNHRWHFTTSLC